MFSPTSSLYGASRAALMAGVGVRKLGLHPIFALGEGPLWTLIRENSLEAIELPSKRWVHREGGWLKGQTRFSKNRAIAQKNLSRLQELRLDLVHSHSLGSPLGAMLARKLGLPHIWHMHELLGTGEGDRFLLGIRHAVQFIDSMTDLIIVNSQFTKAGVEAYCPASKVRVIYYGILDESTRLPAAPQRAEFDSSSRLRILLVGGIQPRKGQDDAILALSELVQRGIDAHLTLAGDGTAEYVRSLKNLAATRKVADRITWTGFVNETSALYRNADVAIVCSRDEPFGIVTVESMSVGLPTIGARSGGILEVIQDGINGLLYEQGDPKHLAEKIQYLAKHSEHRLRMAAQGYQDVFERFGVERYGRELKAVYEEACAIHAQRSN